ncbi:putative pheophorbide a oxygenase [Helianthus annuus]|nr:putative pheophorbide a oxygenase [Helianthus annuus]
MAGWCFSGSGDCKFIPQAPPGGPPLVIQFIRLKKRCVLLFIPAPCKTELCGFGPTLIHNTKKKKPPYIPEVDDPSFTFQFLNRDIPYGYEILIENIMDPAHLPYAHYGIMSTPQPR